MRQQYEARRGTMTIVLWAENWHDALASFELAFTGPDPTEASARRAASYDVVAVTSVPDVVSEFLRAAGRKGGRPSNRQAADKKTLTMPTTQPITIAA